MSSREQTTKSKGGFVDSREGVERRRIVVAEKDPRQRERLRHTMFELGLDIAGLAGDGPEAVQMACLLTPDYVLLDDALPVLSAMDAAYAIRTACPEAATILMTERNEPGLMREAMRCGIRDVVRKPLDIAELAESIRRLGEIRKLQSSQAFRNLLDPSQLPSVFCVTGGKGGVGKTMLATNLALALRHKGEKTVLIDLYTQFGDVASVLNMKPQRTLAELTPMVDDIDWPLLSRYAHEHSSGLHAMFGSDRPLPLDAITVQCLDRVINVLKREYKYIVFDTPPYLHATTLHALSLANAVMLVCNLFDYTTIADTKQLFDTLDGAYVSRDRLNLVVNRVNAQNKFRLEDVERTFDHEVFAQIPNDPKVVALLNTGYPNHEAIRDTPLGEAVRQLRDGLTNPAGARHAAQAIVPEPRRSSRGLLGALRTLFAGG